MANILYSVAFHLAVPFILLRLLFRSVREPDYVANLAERFGFVTDVADTPIWVHAVSAGETIAAIPLVNALLGAGHKVVVTNMTPTGRERCRTLLGDRVVQFYAPYDLPWSVKLFLARVRPRALIMIDTELWPNMLKGCREAGVPQFLVNGRLSERSARGYARVSGLARPMFEGLNHVFAQSASQAERFAALGTLEKNLMVAGSIKFDTTPPEDLETRRMKLAQKFSARKVLIGASTHEGEEAILLEALKVQPEDYLLILAPRHPHRTEQVQDLCARTGFRVARHSRGEVCDESVRVYLVDTMGELLYFYSVAQIALVGGSLVDVGGHNPMEPGSLGIPILMGPFRRNIADIAERFAEAGALLTVTDSDSLAAVWTELMQDHARRASMAASALQVMTENRGALDRILQVITAELTPLKTQKNP